MSLLWRISPFAAGATVRAPNAPECTQLLLSATDSLHSGRSGAMSL